MFSASQLSEEQKEVIRGWVAEGDQMADVQRRLKEDMDFSVTYMDTRFLSLDLDLQFIVEEEPEPEVEPEAPSEEAPLGDPALSGEVAAMPAPTGVQAVRVSLDTIARPGAMVSGKVTFSDGENGLWMIDEAGRPSVDPDSPGYQPTQEDLMEFQSELGKLLEGHA